MGAAKSRRAAFLRDNPFCCFCGGTRPATTIDHVPNRASFPGRIGPDGYEFPACIACQVLLREEEHFFAFLVRLSDQDNRNYDQDTSRRLIRGIKNNFPEFFPRTNLTANEKRRVLRQLGLPMPQGLSTSALPLAAFPQNPESMMRVVGVKIGLALYYKHKGRPAPSGHLCSSFWTQLLNQRAVEAWKELAQDLGRIEIGQRTNTDLGNRFRYIWGTKEEGSPDIFVSIAEFGKGIAVCSMLAHGSVDEARADGWISVSEWAAGIIPGEWG